MVDLWRDLDEAVLDCLALSEGPVTPAEIGRQLGMSAESACSILLLLVREGRVRVCAVERA